MGFLDQRSPQRITKPAAIPDTNVLHCPKGIFALGNRYANARCAQGGYELDDSLIHGLLPGLSSGGRLVAPAETALRCPVVLVVST